MFGMTRVRVTPTMYAFVFHAKRKLPLITKDIDGTETLHRWADLTDEEQARVAAAILTDDTFAFETVWKGNLPEYLLEVTY